jgi:thioredoxin 1
LLTFMKFYADWCKPCQAMLPTMERIKDDFEVDVSFVDVNIEDNPQARADYHIRSIPAFVILRDGQEVSRKVGSMGYADLEEWIDNELGNL